MKIENLSWIPEKLEAIGFEQVEQGHGIHYRKEEKKHVIWIYLSRSDSIATIWWYREGRLDRMCHFNCITLDEIWAHIEFTLNLTVHDID